MIDRIKTLADVDNFCRQLNTSQFGEKSVSGAHGIGHARNTALGTEVVGKLYQLPDRTILLARFPGWMHDFKRSSGESRFSSDEQMSAAMARETLEGLNKTNQFPSTEEEREAVEYAILSHGQYPLDWNDPQRRDLTPQNLRDQIRILNFVSDKMDANGAQAIARRSMFVAGQRLHAQDADLPNYGFSPGSMRNQITVVCVESLLRLSIINPETVYPDILQPLVKPLYAVQRPFVTGLLQAGRLNVEKVAQIILERTHKDLGKNLLDIRGIDAPRNVKDLAELFEKTGGISSHSMEQTIATLVDSCVRTLFYFSEHWQDDFDEVVAAWVTQSAIERQWKTEILAYNDGSWFKSKLEQ